MSQYDFFEITPPLRNVIATSILYIYISPLISAAGLLLALKYRIKQRNEINILAITFLLGLGLMLFGFWFELNLFEGVSFLG